MNEMDSQRALGPLIVALLDALRAMSDPTRLAGMARYGIRVAHALGVSIPQLRATAAALKKERDPAARHTLAAGLWAAELHEARILASMVDAAELVDATQMEAWAADFSSWDLCDQCCMNLFRWTSQAWDRAQVWCAYGPQTPEFRKRAGFALLATLAVGDKRSPDGRFLPFLELIRAGADDPRNFVKKAVNWALRQIGKRSPELNGAAVALCHAMLEQARGQRSKEAAATRWVAAAALRELTAPQTRRRLAP